VKVVTLVGTRPELIKLSLTIAELDRQVDHRLVHTGQNYDFELNEVFFKDLGIRKPDHFLDAAGVSAAKTIAKVIERFDEVLATELPDAVLVLGDTNSCLGIIAAKRRHIPIFHMEAGNRCFDARVPEESNRKIVDHVSDVNLPYTEHGRRYLLAEGIRPDTVFKTGSPMREVLQRFADRIEAADTIGRLGLTRDSYFLVSAHREENVDDPNRLRMLLDALLGLIDAHNLPVLFSAHPRTRERLEALTGTRKDERLRIAKPLGFFDYVALQKGAFCVVSDSGTLTEESGILGFPAVMIRDAHERPEGMDEGTVVMCGLRTERVLDAVRLVRSQKAIRFTPPRDYDADNVSAKVVRIILSYTDYVNRTTWFKI
jgi:UDP-N-acetylglucosamine 2-epimerase (non-hydrolysing)